MSNQETKDVEHPAALAPQPGATAKRPYRVPTLRFLGSVRDLTLGSTRGLRNDGFATKRP